MILPELPRGKPRILPKLPGEGALVAEAELEGDVGYRVAGADEGVFGGLDAGFHQEVADV